jgi:nicotinamide riboside kinase
MKIAVSGSHRTGKTTLVEALAESLPAHTVVEEPYVQLEEEGYEFAHMPSLDDFEVQLERSLESLEESGDNEIFDRCPADLLAYLVTHVDAAAFDPDEWLPRVRRAVSRLDLVVFVPIESPDRVRIADSEEAELRLLVDEELRSILVEDRWDFGIPVLEVSGNTRERVRQVLDQVNQGNKPVK